MLAASSSNAGHLLASAVSSSANSLEAAEDMTAVMTPPLAMQASAMVSEGSRTTLSSIVDEVINTQPIEEGELEPQVLYAVLTSRNELGSWDWTFYVHSGNTGTLFRSQMNRAGTGWTLETEHSYDVSRSPVVVAIVRLTSLDFLGDDHDEIVGEEGLLGMFRSVKLPQTRSMSLEYSSRTWFLDAIGTLIDCSIIECDDVWLLEREIRRCAFTAMDRFLDVEKRSSEGNLKPENIRGWTLYEAQHCS